MAKRRFKSIITIIVFIQILGFGQDSSLRWIVKSVHKDLNQAINYQKKDDISKTKVLFKDLNLHLVEFKTPKTKKELLNDYFYKSELNLAYPDITIERRATPNDPDYPSQWGLDQIGMPDVWDITTGGKAPNGDDIVVAIFDDGYDITHRDYAQNIWINTAEIENNGIDDDNNGYIDDYLGWNATTDNDEHRLRSHGTAVAGIIGAIGDNNTLVAGVNWDVKLMLTSGGRNDNFSLADIVKAYEYIYEQRKNYNESNGAKGAYVVVSNYSGGAANLFPEDFPSWCEIYDLLGQQGVINFTSAPNSDVDVDIVGDLPSTCLSEHLIIVTNSDRQDNKVDFAGFGQQSVDIAAPGDGIVTTGVNGELNPDFTGASASAPFVAGVASLLYSVMCEETYNRSIADPESVARDIRSIILQNVITSPSLIGRTTTGGRIDALSTFVDFRSRKGLGDCCDISFSDISIIDESCLEARDGSITVMVDSVDIRGGLSYRLSSINGSNQSTDGRFNFLAADQYLLNVAANRDNSCEADTTILIEESLEECSFGNFQIMQIGPNPVNGMDQLRVSYQLDEPKSFNIIIFNSIGQTVYRDFIPSDGSGGGAIDVDLNNLAMGVYHVGIRANDLLDVESFVVIR